MGTKVEAAISHFKERRQSSLHGTLDFFSPDFFFLRQLFRAALGLQQN